MPIFSGPKSKELWKKINKVTVTKPGRLPQALGDLLYILGCHMQEMESEVERLYRRVAELQQRVNKVPPGYPGSDD